MKNINRQLAEVSKNGSLYVFDFDDTLVMTDAQIHVTDKRGKTRSLSSGEFATYHKKHDDVFDFSDFDKLINPRAITWTNKILHNIYRKHGPNALAILTARGSSGPIVHFLTDIGLSGIEIATMGSNDPALKAQWISARIKRDNIKTIKFFDDSYKNIIAVKELELIHPGVKILIQHIVH